MTVPRLMLPAALLMAAALIAAPASASADDTASPESARTTHYMYMYCKRSPDNPLCKRLFSREIYTQRLLQERLRASAASKPPYTAPASTDQPSPPVPASEVVQAPVALGGESRPVPINSTRYLEDWIKRTFGIEPPGRLDAPQLAELFTKLMWCSRIGALAPETPCDYEGRSPEELRRSYERLVSRVAKTEGAALH